MTGVNWQPDKGFARPPAGLPVLAIVPDWTPNLGAFVGMDVRLWRFMGGVQQAAKLAPPGADVCWWNELPNGDRSAQIAEVAQMRAARPDLRIHYGAEHAGGIPSPALVAACDVLDRHCAVWEMRPTDAWVTELELTPATPEWDQIVDWCQRAPGPVFVWGADQQQADINLHSDILAALAALNQQQGATDMAVDPAKIDQVLAQNALLAQANYDVVKMLEAVAAGQTIDPAVLQEAKTQVNALNPDKFTFK